MRIHSDLITAADVYRAANVASGTGDGIVYVRTLSEHGSRKRRRAFELSLAGDGTKSRKRTQADRSQYAATWDAWGWFLLDLFTVDPAMIAGPYAGVDQFHELTDDRFRLVSA